MRIYHLSLVALLLAFGLQASAQRFFNLTSDQVSVDSVLPEFVYTVPLAGEYRDSSYTASLLYPEFIDMTAEDIRCYHLLSSDPLPALPQVAARLTYNRKQGALRTSFCPLVYRDGKYQILVSFMLRIDAVPVAKGRGGRAKRDAALSQGGQPSRLAAFRAPRERYAAHSVLASGRWVKIRVPSTGVYQLTADLVRQAGFPDPSRVKVYGYGGNLQNETLVADELAATDDLREVPTCTVGGRRLFYARGPVSWSSKTVARRTRNPYSDYGYYFLTSSEAEPATLDSAAFLSSFYPSADDYHTLYEVDGYAWFQGGRNLFDTEAIANGRTKRVVLANPSRSATGQLSVNVSAGTASRAQVSLGDSILGTINVTLQPTYDHGNERSATFAVSGLHATDTVKITTLSGGPIRLDYVSMAWPAPAPAPNLNGDFPVPQFVYAITNQDHHADPQADMVIIIPTSQKLLAQARRLAQFHEQHDSLRVNIVPADELFNEFSSGTPDANAYRRYMKMLYDRAETDADMPRFLLLFGDGVWDNRMLTADTRSLAPDDYLLCYESENSFNEITCYVDDGFFTLLDDGEGADPQRTDQQDIAVGRFPVTTEADAKVMVDKTIGYVENHNAGAWQNTLVFMGDDGNNNLHMRDENETAEDIAARYPGYQIRKVMWDAYTGETSSTGNSYPEVTALVKQLQQQGALIMDYAGHGRADQVSHETVLRLNDFKEFTNKNLPLWITASCDIMAFDGTIETIGESAVLNPNGGAVAFFGTTRTVYASQNKHINQAYLRSVLGQTNGKPTTIGEAQRLAKNYMITSGQDRTTNKMQYTLLGDPAISLCQPTLRVVVDSINGTVPSAARPVSLKAGSVARVAGHVVGAPDFDGVLTATVMDSRELVTCKMNASAEADTPFQFYNRTKTLYSGSDSIRGGRFDFSFAVPVDLNYAGEAGLMTLYAVNNAHTLEGNGSCGNYIAGGESLEGVDSIGPKIYCYLNTPEFEDGGEVNTTPYFVAQVSDDSGLNTTGNGVGHDLELVIDGDAAKTYNLNGNFSYDFGSYTSGQTFFSLPALEPGLHSLQFRAWDVMNNSSTARLTFKVVKSLEPTIYDVSVTDNPATTSTTFVIGHSFAGSTVDVVIDVFDASGRVLWSHSESGASADGPYTVAWDLTQSGGGRLQTGVYLYRVRLSSDGSSQASKTKKLIVINNN